MVKAKAQRAGVLAIALAGCLFYTDEDRDRDGDGEFAIAFGGADCDDDNAEINAKAGEVCNLIDDNCDGSVDNGATDATDWYVDGDGDGIGQEATVRCYAEAGISSARGDCDDTNAAVYPGAFEDVCTLIDEDCDGVGGAESLAYNARLGGEAGGLDGLGAAVATGQQDGVGEVLVAGSAAGGATLIFALEQSTDTNSSERWARVEGGGDAVAFGDAFVNTVDRDDLIIGDASWNNGAGRVGIFQLAQTGGDHDWNTVAVSYEAAEAGDRLGEQLAFFQGDGVYSSILMIGAPGTDAGRGAVYILQLNAGGDSGSREVTSASYGVVTSRDYVVNASLGGSITGWSGGDGGLFGVYGASRQQGRFGPETGEIAISPIGTIDILNTATHRYIGAGAGDRFATALATDDVDGDGLNEVMVSAPGRDTTAGNDAGTIYLLAGSLIESNFAVGDQEYEMDQASITIEGDAERRGLGRDITLDGRTLFASAWLAECEGEDPGSVYVFDLSSPGTFVASDAQRVIVGEPEAEAGTSLLETANGLWVGEAGTSRFLRYAQR